MRKKILPIFAITFIISNLPACMGGGTFGTGIQGYGTNSSDGVSLKYDILGKLTDAKGKPLTGAIVKAESGALQVQGTTDKTGNFKIKMKTSSGSPITFTVTKGAVNSSCNALISPAGEDFVKLSLKLGSGNTLVCP